MAVMRQRCVLADGHRLPRIADPDEVCRLGGLVREDRESPVDLQRVGGHDLGTQSPGYTLRDGGLP